VPSDRDSPPGLRDVARRAGVSLSSASRALAEGTSASPELRERVRAAARELGYEPNLLAQSLSRGATGLVGFMVREIESPGVPPVLHGAEAALRDAGYALVFATSEGRADLAASYVRLLRQRRVDGLVLALADAEHPDARRELERVQVPCVLFDRELDWLDASAVLFDHASSARDAAEHLLALGHRRIAFVAGMPTMRTTPEVEAGLRAGLAATDEATLLIDHGDFTADHGREATMRLLSGPNPPTALVAGNGQIAHGVIEALRDLGLRTGDDVSLVCAEDPPALRLVDPPVAAIRWDFGQAGRTLAELLLRRLDGGPAERVVLGTSFVPGASCAPPKSAAPA
jgi:LacI family transcriptional regulator